MSGPQIIFFVVAALLIVSSILVVFQRNVVHSAVALVAALFLIAVLFLSLNAPMVGVLQILVYAGAIMVLFLFVIILLNPVGLEQRRSLWWGAQSVVDHSLCSPSPIRTGLPCRRGRRGSKGPGRFASVTW